MGACFGGRVGLDFVPVKQGRKIGILYHPHRPRAKTLAEELARRVGTAEGDAWLCPVGGEDIPRRHIEETRILIAVGGDGTILRAAHITLPYGIPIVGVNLGNLGFLAELRPEEAMERLPGLLAGGGRVEERTMLRVELSPSVDSAATRRAAYVDGAFHALNDVVVGRGAILRVIYVDAEIDGAPFVTYKGDGVMVATATGSTGYAWATGGPLLYPLSHSLILKPISPHLSMDTPVVLPSATVVRLRVRSEHQAVLSIDGQVDVPLKGDEVIQVSASPYVTRFLRSNPPGHFYTALQRWIGWKGQNNE